MIKIREKRVMVLLASVISGILFISIIACAKPQGVKVDVKGNAERAHEELKKEEKR